MPASIVSGQVASGGVSATSVNATLPAGTTAGNTVFVVFGTNGRTMATTAGFVVDSPSSIANARIQVFRRSNVPAGETSWTFTTGAALAEAWVAFEVEGLDASTPLDVVVSAVSAASSGTAITSNTTPQSTAYDAFVLAAWVGTIASTTPGTLTGITNGFTEIAQQGAAGATNSAVLSVASLPAQSLSTFSSTATHSATLTATTPGAGVALVYAAAGSRRAANVQVMAGFEWGTAAGLATGSAGGPPFDAISGSPAVVSTSPRSGTYCLELSASAAAEWVQWTNASLGSTASYLVVRLGVYFPTSLPGSDVVLAIGGTNTAQPQIRLAYRTASQKLGLTVGDGASLLGTEQLSTNTVTADTWYAVDMVYDGSAATLVGNWQIDGVDQTQATCSAGAPAGINGLTLGWVASTTATVRYDDVVVSRTLGHYPLGDFKILPLKPDPAGTLTISGTTGNFQTFTANGTMAAWNAATALAAIDDLPPTIGATADGIAQVTAAASDYVEIPMETYNAAANGAALRAVRMYAAGWGAGSPAAATLGFRGFDGTTETVLFAAADPTFTNSTTTPGWVAKMFKPTGGWTQAKLDALTFRMGFSSDATPDIGIHSIMAEVAVRAGQTQTMFGAPGDVQVTANLDPDSAGIISLTTQGTDYKGTALSYDVSGTPTNATVTPGGSRTDTIGAPDAPTVDYVAIYPDPEGVADA